MNLYGKGIIYFGLLIIGCSLVAQDTSETLEDIFKVDYDTPLTLDFDAEEKKKEEPKEEKKKKKRNVFFGIKTRKAHTRTVQRQNLIIETFWVLKTTEQSPEYATNFYWLDPQKGKIVNSTRVKKNAKILHGPYKKRIGEQVLEEGWFYKGLKHRRWVRFNKYDILQGKSYWWKGWPQESKIVYYDFQKTKLKEIIPVHYGEKNGKYWAFHANGKIALRGNYKFDHRVGQWREYYQHGSVKREATYPKDPFDGKFRPYITKEWNEKGKLIYDRNTEIKE